MQNVLEDFELLLSPFDLCKDLKPGCPGIRQWAKGGCKYSLRKDMHSDNSPTFVFDLLLPEACGLLHCYCIDFGKKLSVPAE